MTGSNWRAEPVAGVLKVQSDSGASSDRFVILADLALGLDERLEARRR